ncbi:MAG: hypothetical protein ACP5QO_03000 [Clostridia bacterium]
MTTASRAPGRVALATHLPVMFTTWRNRCWTLSRELPEHPHLLAGAGRLPAEICQRATDGCLGQVDAFEDAVDRSDSPGRTGPASSSRSAARRLPMAELRRTAGICPP